MRIQWRQAEPKDVGLLARFADRLGDDWTYGLLTDFDSLESVFTCTQCDGDEGIPFYICEVQQVEPTGGAK